MSVVTISFHSGTGIFLWDFLTSSKEPCVFHFNGMGHIPLSRYCGPGVITYKLSSTESGRNNKNQSQGWLVSLVTGDYLACHFLG
jgi:hypothetical protein